MQSNVERKGEGRRRRYTFTSRVVYGDISWTTRKDNVREMKKAEDIAMKNSI